MFAFEPTRVTKEALKGLRSEEEYMSFYLGIVPDDCLHRNPLRYDRNPTASFYRANNGELVFKDFKTGFHANFVGVVMEKFQVPYYKALNIIGNDFGLISKPHYTKNDAAVEYNGTKVTHKEQATIQCKIKEYTEEELQWWLSFGITKKTLEKFHVYSIESVFLNGNYQCSSIPSNPIYGYYYGKKDGRELWKIYFPFKGSFRFLLNNNELQGAKQLPKTGEYVVVTKSLKDVMTLFEMGIPAVAPQAESVILTEKQYLALKARFKHVIFNGDWDRAGQTFMIKSRTRFKGYTLSFVNKEKFAKDISDFVKKFDFQKGVNLVARIKTLIESGKLDYQLNRCKSE